MSLIVAIVGLSGVGKTTLINAVARNMRIQHLNAGELIGEARGKYPIDRDDLRLANIADNQNLLVDGFNRRRDPNIPIIILDGHTVIDAGSGLKPIPSAVFKALNVNIFIFVCAEPEEIYDRRASDIERSRPELTSDTLKNHQSIAIEATKVCADELGVPIKFVASDSIEETLLILKDSLFNGLAPLT